MSAPSATLRFLHRQRRRLSGQWLAWSLAAGLAALALGRVAAPGRLSFAFALQVLAMVLAAGWLVRWVRQVRALTPAALASQLDARHGLEALVESALELQGVETQLGAAVRQAADERLARLPVGGTRRWIAAWCGAAVAGLVCLGVFLFAPPLPTVTANPVTAGSPAQPPKPAAPKPVPPPALLRLAWKSPARLEPARSREEVALLLHAEVNRPIQGATLEIELNGRPAHSRPVAPEITGGHPATPEADWPLTLFLDETAGQPYDLVGYFVQASVTEAGRSVTGKSKRQFVEILPLAENPRLPAPAKAALAQLNTVKLAQLDLLEATGELLPSDAPVALLAGLQLAELARRQQSLAGESAAPVAAATALPLKNDAIPALGALRDEIQTAQAALAQGRPADAMAAQGKVLAIIAAAERAIAAMTVPEAADSAAQPARPPDAADPARATTPAGTLEQLARRQADNNALASAAVDDPAKLGALATEQTAIARALERLATRRALIPPVQSLVERAQATSAEAARHFALQDLTAGREPAAETETLLRRAVELQEEAGRKAANAVLEQTRAELKNAADLADAEEQAAQIQRLSEQLQDEIERQRQQGSSAAAQRLGDLAAQIAKARKASQPKPGAPAPEKLQAGKESKSEGKPGEEGPPVFEATLRGPAEAATAEPAGTAQLTLTTPAGEANLTVTFGRTPAAISEQRLVVVSPGRPDVTVAKPTPGAFSRQALRWDPASGLTPEQIVLALNEGRLAIEVATARAPRGELTGRFVRLVRPVQGMRSGRSQDRSGGGGGVAVDQSTAAMPSVAPEGTPMGAALLRLSAAAAESQVALVPDQALAQTIRQLKASAAQLAAANPDPGALARLQLAVEKAQLLAATDPRMAAAAGAVADAAGTPDPAALKALLAQISQLATELEQAPGGTKRDEWLRRFPPEQIDPAYRAPAQDYFETLSREASPR